MTMRPVPASGPLFGQAAALFDAYRAHYGQARTPEATGRWLREQVARGRLRIDAATEHGEVRGIITSAVVPASLTLREFWLIRDLYVDPAYRRRGIGRALLGHVAGVARVAGALRLSLQTETVNAAALHLYASCGFRSVGDLRSLTLTL